jgi:predicted ATPase
LVTLTGVGGVGKTRLALEIALRLTDESPDGVWLFELAAVTDPAAIPDAVAAVLGITQQPGKTVSGSVAAALEGRVRLLVFDNCEHVRDAAAAASTRRPGAICSRVLRAYRNRTDNG